MPSLYWHSSALASTLNSYWRVKKFLWSSQTCPNSFGPVYRLQEQSHSSHYELSFVNVCNSALTKVKQSQRRCAPGRYLAALAGQRGDKKPLLGQRRRFWRWDSPRGWRWGCPQHTAPRRWWFPRFSAGTWCCRRRSRSPSGRAGLCLSRWWGKATRLQRRGDNNQIHQQYKTSENKQLATPPHKIQPENPFQTTHHRSWCFSFCTAIFPKGRALGFVIPSWSCREKASPLLWLSDVCAAWFQLSPVRCKY